MGQQILSGAQEVNLVLKDGSHQFEDSVTQVNQAMTATAKEIATQCDQISEELKNAMELLGMNTERIRTGITGVISTAMESVEESTKNLLSRSQETTKSVLASIQQSVQASVDISAQARNESLRAVEAVNQTVVHGAERSMQAVEKQTQEAVNRTNEAVNSQLRQLDEALSRQLNAALQELGSALATIARHLAESYQRNSQRPQP